jgi:hypothetical protein
VLESETVGRRDSKTEIQKPIIAIFGNTVPAKGASSGCSELSGAPSIAKFGNSVHDVFSTYPYSKSWIAFGATTSGLGPLLGPMLAILADRI